jgi:hypothetical protein
MQIFYKRMTSASVAVLMFGALGVCKRFSFTSKRHTRSTSFLRHHIWEDHIMLSPSIVPRCPTTNTLPEPGKALSLNCFEVPTALRFPTRAFDFEGDSPANSKQKRSCP